MEALIRIPKLGSVSILSFVSEDTDDDMKFWPALCIEGCVLRIRGKKNTARWVHWDDLQVLNRILLAANWNRVPRDTLKLNYTFSIFCRHKSTSESEFLSNSLLPSYFHRNYDSNLCFGCLVDGVVTIGQVKKSITNPSRPEYVPVHYCKLAILV